MDMLIIWLGAFFLLLFSFDRLQRSLRGLTSGLVIQSLEGLQSRSFSQTLKFGLLASAAMASPAEQALWALRQLNWRLLSRRSSLLLLCLAPIGSWLWIGTGLFFLKVNGLLLLGLAGFAFVLIQWIKVFYKSKYVESAAEVLMWLGVIYFSGEALLRTHSVFQTVLGTGEWAYLLVDKRWSALSLLFVIGLVKSVLLPFQGWSFWLGLALVPLGSLSLVGALALMSAEMLVSIFRSAWQFRRTNMECRQAALQWSLVSALGIAFGFFVVLSLIPTLGWGGFAAGDLWGLSLQVIQVFVILAFTRFVAGMAWGHFVSPLQVAEMQEPFFAKGALFVGAEDSSLMKWSHGRVEKRLGEIQYHLQGIETLPSERIPGHLKQRLLDEKAQLASLAQALNRD